MNNELNSAAQAQAAMPDLAKALRKAYNYGQTYWQQADSEYLSQQKKSNETADRFADFVAETVATFAAAPAAALQPVAGLTDAEIEAIMAQWSRTSNSRMELCRAIEAHIKGQPK